MGAFDKVEKIDAINYNDFVERYVKKRIPVVLKNASGAWKSNTIFTPEFFKENFGDYETSSDGVKYTMSQILEITANSTPQKPAPYPILFDIPVQMPKLMEMLKPIHMNFAKPNWFRSKLMPYGKFGNGVELFIGGSGNQYSLHQDLYHTNAWITQLYGQKKFILFAEGNDDYYYGAGLGNALSPINILTPDFEKYPKFKNAEAKEILLEPGETIYIPNGVWHTTVSHSHNISLIIDQLNSSNFKSWRNDMFLYKRDGSKLKASLSYAYATFIGTFFKTAELLRAKD